MRNNVLELRAEPREADIQKAAYFLWVELGRPAGRDLEMWLAAKEMLQHRHAALARSSPPPVGRIQRT